MEIFSFNKDMGGVFSCGIGGGRGVGGVCESSGSWAVELDTATSGVFSCEGCSAWKGSAKGSALTMARQL